MPLELYIHIPFCVKKCAYCDFLSYTAEKEVQKAYIEAMKKEILARGQQTDLHEKEVVSIFFGGGTPSILPPEWIAELLDTVRAAFQVCQDTEISMESNPGTLSREKLLCYRKAGINRLSIGCQSTVDEELQMLGRIHSWKEFLDSYEQARACGFENINVDLMSGLPGQTVRSWEQSLRKIAELGPEHISAYSLILEEGTPLFEMQDQYAFPEEEEERSMYELTHTVLEKYGYLQYEISNYSLPGKECRHNRGYWIGTEYLGLGLGAASFIGNRRFSNTSDREEYIASAERPENLEEVQEILTREDRMGERMILGLRLIKGVSGTAFEEEFGLSLMEQYGPIIEKYLKWNLLEWEGNHLHLTREGISVSNQVMAEFL